MVEPQLLQILTLPDLAESVTAVESEGLEITSIGLFACTGALERFFSIASLSSNKTSMAPVLSDVDLTR